MPLIDDRIIGRYLGYPKCCVEFYVACNIPEPITLEKLKRFYTSDQIAIHRKDFGFVACPNHASMVMDGNLSLYDLIRDRHPDLPMFEESLDMRKAAKKVLATVEKEKNSDWNK